MFCPSCGKEIAETSVFCLHCGKAVGAGGQQKPAEQKSKVLVGVLVGLVVVLAVVVGTVMISNETRKTTPGPFPTPPREPVLRPVSERLTSGQLTVRAGKYVFIKFKVDPTIMRDAHVVGSFHASGGSGNDIQAVIAEEDEFENWINGHEAHVLYSTGRTTNGKIDVPITGAGTYHLAFSNSFSVLSDKDVFADVELRYLTPQ
jgi:hypothetical protein